MDKVRKELLATLSENAEPEAWVEKVIGLLTKHNARDDGFKLEEFVESMSEKDQSKFWDGVLARINPYIESVARDEEEDEGNGDDGEGVEERKGGEGSCADTAERSGAAIDACTAFRLLSALLAMAQAALTVGKKASLPLGMLRVVMALHNVLFQLSGLDGEALQASIAKVCEQWWLKEKGGAEFLVPQLVPYLVARSLEEDAKEVLVKRVYALRGALLLFEYEDQGTEAFKLLLLQCFLKPTYLRSSDGRRFLTYLFGLHPDIILDIHATVKNQLPFAKKKVVQAYGDVYFRAWKAAKGPYLDNIEQECIQDLMRCAVATPSPSLYATLRLFLSAFHSQKRLREVDTMLLRLYNPIIWRSLQVANPVVRAQATGLFVDAFPLQNPDAGTVEIATLLQKQLDMLQKLLNDPDPRVRVAAIAGVCRIMTAFWEAIPLNVTKVYITRLVTALAFDSTSGLVRIAVVDGLTTLLDQPLAHPVLKTALPMTAPLLHDKAERVRAAYLRLLLRVKTSTRFKFYDVVPTAELLARFVEDSGSKLLSKRMADLLLNSFLPQGSGVTAREQVNRCIKLLHQNKAAALAFYGSIRPHISLGRLCKFASTLLRLVFAFADASVEWAEEDEAPSKAEKGKKKGGGRRNNRKRPRDKVLTDEDDEGANDDAHDDDEATESACAMRVTESVVAGMLEVVRVMWASAREELEQPGNKNGLDLIEQALKDGDIANLYQRLSNPTPLLELATLSPSCFSPLGPVLVAAIKDGSEDTAGPIAALLCSWGRTSEVVDLIAMGLEAAGGPTSTTVAASTTSSAKASSGPKRKRAAKVALPVIVSAAKALAMLDHILAGQSEAAEVARAQMVAQEREANGDEEGSGRLTRAMASLRATVEKGMAGGLKTIEQDEARAVLVGGIEAWLRFELHTWGAMGQADNAPLLTAIITWLENSVLPPAGLSLTAAGANTGAAAALFSPMSPPPRRPRVDGDQSPPHSPNAHELQGAAFAQEVLAVALTILGDWVACGGAADTVATHAEAWAQRLFLPALMGPQDTTMDRMKRAAVLSVLPQLCRLTYQLALLESRSSTTLPAPVLEVVIRAADHQLTAQPTHRYEDSSVDGGRCLSSLMGLYSRLKASKPALTSLTQHLWALCLREPEDSSLRRALVAALARSTPAVNATITDALSGLKVAAECDDARSDAAAASEGGDGSSDDAKSVEARAQLLAELLEAVPEKPRAALISKVANVTFAMSTACRTRHAQRDAQHAMDTNRDEDITPSKQQDKVLLALERLDEKLKSLSVAVEAQ